MKYFINFLLSLIYKEKCCICGIDLSCAKSEKILCKNCLKTVEILSGFAQTKINGVEIFSACIYDGIVRTLIHKLKFQHNKNIARVLAKILTDFFDKILVNNSLDILYVKTPKTVAVVPIPTNRKNVQIRGYNNVYEIAKEFAEINGFILKNDILIKIKDTKPQFELKKNQRKSNVSGCFKVDLKNYHNETILLIDDIITTGATLNEAITTFQAAGINNIVCITVSKAV